MREVAYSVYDRRKQSSLIFETSEVIRRIRNYPADWRDWSDADLYALSLKPV